MNYQPRLKKEFNERIISSLKEEYSYSNVMMVPQLKKIVISKGVGGAVADKKLIDHAIDELSTISGQKAISTLSKITVPLASDQSANNQGLLMPKLQYRFRVSLENFGVSADTTEITKQVVDVSRPNVTFEEITLDVNNDKFIEAHFVEDQTPTDLNIVINEINYKSSDDFNSNYRFEMDWLVIFLY